MKTPAGFIEVIDHAGLSALVSINAIMLVAAMLPTETGPKTMILLKHGERLSSMTEYSALVERIAGEQEEL